MIEKHSQTWKALEKILEERLQTYREDNDSMRLEHDKTQFLRGRIREVQDLLKLADKD